MVLVNPNRVRPPIAPIAVDLLATSLEAQGVPVLFCPNPAPFPSVELALEQRKADTALLLSAGNQPFWYSGMIMLSPPTNQPLLQVAPDTPIADQVRQAIREAAAPLLERLGVPGRKACFDRQRTDRIFSGVPTTQAAN